jgi:hypothetical protein
MEQVISSLYEGIKNKKYQKNQSKKQKTKNKEK